MRPVRSGPTPDLNTPQRSARASCELIDDVWARVIVSCHRCQRTLTAVIPVTQSVPMRRMAGAFVRGCACGGALRAIARAVEDAA